MLYRRYERLLLAYFRRRVDDAELAADLTAEVFAAALVSSARFRLGGPPVSAWLFAIARNTLANSRRRGRVEDRARRRLGMEPIVLEDDDLARIDQLGDTRAALALLEQLAPDQREAIRAHVLEDRSYEEIAGELRCSPSVIRQRVSRGLARLRERLMEET